MAKPLYYRIKPENVQWLRIMDAMSGKLVHLHAKPKKPKSPGNGFGGHDSLLTALCNRDGSIYE